MTDLVTRAKEHARKMEAAALRLASVAGLAQSEEKIARQSRAYWRNAGSRSLDANSHAFGGIPEETWAAIGADALQRFESAASALRWSSPHQTVMDYGCGHGAQACAFAPNVREIIGVDIQQSALDACADRITRLNSSLTWQAAPNIDRAPLTAFSPVLIDNPEDVYGQVSTGHVDAFVSFYTFELIPGQHYGERILRMAFDMLRPGGMGLVQFKYPVSWWDESRRFGYNHRTVSGTTKYRPDEFWSMLTRVGFEPGHITVCEQDALDTHYAYASFVKPAGGEQK